MRGRRRILSLLGRWDAPRYADPGRRAYRGDRRPPPRGGRPGGRDRVRRGMLSADDHPQPHALSGAGALLAERPAEPDPRSSRLELHRAGVAGTRPGTRFDATPSGRLAPAVSQEHREGATTACCGDEIHQFGNFEARGTTWSPCTSILPRPHLALLRARANDAGGARSGQRQAGADGEGGSRRPRRTADGDQGRGRAPCPS